MDVERAAKVREAVINLLAVAAGGGLGLWLFESLAPAMEPEQREMLGAGIGALVGLVLVRRLSP